jgi:hypothetical protein
LTSEPFSSFFHTNTEGYVQLAASALPVFRGFRRCIAGNVRE